MRTDEAHAFADDELSPEQTTVFRAHLRHCRQCLRVITGDWELSALVRSFLKKGGAGE